MTASLVKLFTRDLQILTKEINAYKNEQNLWLIENGINNSAGNLCLHINGNLQHFIGAILGDSGYKRNRDLEFNAQNISRKKLLNEIDVTKKVVTRTLENLIDEQLSAKYPIEIFQQEVTTEYFLIHLHGHLTYHLGQISYHRRLLD